jgi:hypothetical protein
MVDDKRRILAAMKRSWGGRLTTVFPRQCPMRSTRERLGDLMQYDRGAFLGGEIVI